jgi:hypothetical protein
VTTANALLTRARAAGFRVTLLPDRRVNVRPTPPPDLLAELRNAREAITDLLAAETTTPRLTRPRVCPGDPPAPIIAAEATRLLVIAEISGANPRLTPDGILELARAEMVTAETRAAVREHQDDITAILEYRALLERLFPVEAKPPPRQP